MMERELQKESKQWETSLLNCCHDGGETLSVNKERDISYSFNVKILCIVIRCIVLK